MAENLWYNLNKIRKFTTISVHCEQSNLAQ